MRTRGERDSKSYKTGRQREMATGMGPGRITVWVRGRSENVFMVEIM